MTEPEGPEAFSAPSGAASEPEAPDPYEVEEFS